MAGVTPALASGAHIAGIALVFAFSAMRWVALGREDVAATRHADNGNGLGAVLLYGAGAWRLFGELEKPLGYYTDNPVFWVKVGLLALAGMFEVYPQVVVLPWHFRHARGLPIEATQVQFRRMRRCVAAELACMVAIVLVAPFMARGLGVAASPTPPVEHPGRAIYERWCAACHGADGRASGGRSAPSFVDEPEVLAREDDTLLRSIEHGKSGPRGVMPAWGNVLDASERRAVLEYVRSRFGASASDGPR